MKVHHDEAGAPYTTGCGVYMESPSTTELQTMTDRGEHGAAPAARCEHAKGILYRDVAPQMPLLRNGFR